MASSIFESENGICLGSNCLEETGSDVSGAMWFGPRLGRRRRFEEKISLDDDKMNTITDGINLNGWPIQFYPGAGFKRQAPQFTPRLGRELANGSSKKYISYDDVGSRSFLLDNNEDLFDIQQRVRSLSIPLTSDFHFHHHLPVLLTRLGRQMMFQRKI
ncbi:hypothetical protein HCN44_005950 [Aphidius gifuensis]|uniref:Uncharacterized protein n=2 Tax=Aphidius gifuensis TaxID=684658 RepID=A0A834Y064_APHGI|nr:hypothetical protein HCN44_005950 [Aphidius gifuensis]